MTSYFEQFSIPDPIVHRIAHHVGPVKSSSLISLNSAWKSLLEPQLHRRILHKFFPTLSYTNDLSPGVGASLPPLDGYTWKTLFELLICQRPNQSWNPEIASPSQQSSSAPSASPSANPSLHPKINEAVHMPLPDNHDTLQKKVALPPGFEWTDLDPSVDTDMDRLVKFLSTNSLEDSDGLFKLGWTQIHLTRQLQFQPSPLRIFDPDYHIKKTHRAFWIGVQTNSNTGPKNLVAFIAAIPIQLKIYSKVVPFYLVRHLCVHKKMRLHRVARVIVKELSRRIHQEVHESLRQATFTLGVQMPFKLMAEYGAYHRTFKYDEYHLAGCTPSISKEDVPLAFTASPRVRPVVPDDLPKLFPFVMSYLEKFKISISYNGIEFAHRYLPRPGYTYSYVQEDEQNNLTGFFCLSEMHFILMNPVPNVSPNFRIAYCDLIFPATDGELVKTMLVVARDLDFAELEIGTHMEHSRIIDNPELNIKAGTGKAFNYLHNWICDDIEAKDWGLSEEN